MYFLHLWLILGITVIFFNTSLSIPDLWNLNKHLSKESNEI
ncbi:MAG: hypothetical protein ACI942_002415 [Planctomycetota bacterium]